MRVSQTVECPVHESFRVAQVSSLFDVPIAQKSKFSFDVEVPGEEEDWKIGAIIGPSGSGKSTVARHVYGDKLWKSEEVIWPNDKAVIDCFETSVKPTVDLLTAVGFSSPPAWVKPYSVLSNGEKFRCDLARALLSDRPLIAYDEFTSFLDRTVAKIGSLAISKAIQSGKINKRLVVVSCHSDILEWIQPSWVLDMSSGQLARGALRRRPEITIEIMGCKREAWDLFRRHHYLSSEIHKGSQCFMASWNGEPVGFCSVMSNMGWKGQWRLNRVVILPDYQGIGIGTRLCAEVARIWLREREDVKKVSIITSHPGMLRHFSSSRQWRLKRLCKLGNNKHGAAKAGSKTGHTKPAKCSGLRPVASFEFVGK